MVLSILVRVDASTETAREEDVDDIQYNGVGPSGDATGAFREFMSHLRQDPRYPL